MEPRIGRQENGTITYEVDLGKVNRAVKKAGLTEQFYVPLSNEEGCVCARKGLSVLQWRLLNLFKHMFDQELDIASEEYDLNFCGFKNPIRRTGLSFKQKMLKNEEIAEKVFSEWANRIGVNHLYNLSLRGDTYEIHSCNHSIVTCIDSNEEIGYVQDDEVTEPLCRRGVLISLSNEGLSNSSGKNVYQRFVQLLKSLK